MKTIRTLFYSFLSAVFVAVGIQYFTGNWNEEYLNYSLSEPQQLKDGVWLRGVELRNNGIDPALHVKVFVTPQTGSPVPKVDAEFDNRGTGGSFVGEFERVRRKEVVPLLITSIGAAVTKEQISIKSDRSIAELRSSAPWPFGAWSWWSGIGTFFIVYIALAIAIPARRDYLERARKFKESDERH